MKHFPRPNARPPRARVVALAMLLALAIRAAAQALPAVAPTAPRVAPVSLRIEAPSNVNRGEARDVAATIANDSAKPVLVLPNMIRLAISGAGAEYVPYPGPPIDPWGGAHELAPGASSAVSFRDLSDRRGIWRLPPGEYRIVARYDVPPELAPPPSIADPSRLWRGVVESPPATMRIR